MLYHTTSFDDWTGSGFAKLRKFATALLARPALVIDVKELRCRGFCMTANEAGVSREQAWSALARALVERLKTVVMPAPVSEKVAQGLYRGSHGMLILALIYMCRRLRVLEFTTKNVEVLGREASRAENILASVVGAPRTRTGPSSTAPLILQELRELKVSHTMFLTDDEEEWRDVPLISAGQANAVGDSQTLQVLQYVSSFRCCLAFSRMDGR